MSNKKKKPKFHLQPEEFNWENLSFFLPKALQALSSSLTVGFIFNYCPWHLLLLSRPHKLFQVAATEVERQRTCAGLTPLEKGAELGSYYLTSWILLFLHRQQLDCRTILSISFLVPPGEINAPLPRQHLLHPCAHLILWAWLFRNFAIFCPTVTVNSQC